MAFKTMSYVKATDNVAFADGVDEMGDPVRILGYKDAVSPVKKLPIGEPSCVLTAAFVSSDAVATA